MEQKNWAEFNEKNKEECVEDFDKFIEKTEKNINASLDRIEGGAEL